MKKILSFLVASGFYVGYFPFASGTVASFAIIPFAFLTAYYGGACAVLALAAIIYLAGFLATREVLKYTKHDPSFVVADEYVGQLIAVIPIACTTYAAADLTVAIGHLWPWYLAAFLLFRFFDIFKMGPAKYFDSKIMSATGVMLDDVFAGIFGAIILWGIVLIAR